MESPLLRQAQDRLRRAQGERIGMELFRSSLATVAPIVGNRQRPRNRARTASVWFVLPSPAILRDHRREGAYGPTCPIDRHRRRRRVGRGRRPAAQVRAPAARRGRVQRPRGRRPRQERRRRPVHGWLLDLQHGRVSRHQSHLHRQHDGRRLVVRDPRRPRGRGNRGRLLRGRPHHPRTGRPQRSGAPACGPEPPIVAVRRRSMG